VNGLIVSIQHDDGRRESLSNWAGLALAESTPEGTVRTPVGPAEVPELLASRFALEGVPLGEDERLTASL
jgi:hypothetical protein